MKKKKSPFIKTYILFSITIIIGVIAFFDNPYKDNDNQKKSENEKLFSSIKADLIEKISITKDNQTLTLSKEGEWKIESDNNYPADKNIVSTMSQILETIKKGEIVSTNTKKQSTYKVSENENNLIVSFNTKEDHKTFYIGIGGPSRDSQYIRLAESDEVLLVRNNMSSIFDKTIEQLRDKTIFNFDSNTIKNITIQSGQNIFQLNKNNEDWFINEIKIKQEKATSLLSTIANLQASGFVIHSEEGNDYNTSENNFEAKILIDLDEESRTLYIGKIEEAIYAKKDSSDTIFKLNSYLLNQLDINIDDYKEEQPTE